ncbi:MAG TPA: hypothetical protein VFP37_10425 [Steroidobacteraceae bacterium]|nr:hypothetical protein [Steroidobacteraceae bacterium]
MGPKLLFVLGIVLAHGALGAVWVQQEVAEIHAPVPTCVNSPGPLPWFQPPLEVLAMQIEPANSGDAMLP